MKRKLIAIGLLSCSLLSACGYQEFSSSPSILERENVADNDANEIEIKDTEDEIAQTTPFWDPFVKGKLSYTVQSCNIYTMMEEANVENDMLIEPHNTYFSQEVGEKYQKISDFINDDGSIVDTHVFVVLEMKIENEDAIGLIKKNEFTISSIALRGGKNVSQYNPAYFSEAGKTNPDQPLHYILNQSDSLDIRLGYFVLKEDIENLVGVVSDSEVQFSINEVE